jgi:quinol monooxygenase YgiN
MAGYVQVLQFKADDIEAIEQVAHQMREEFGDDFKVVHSTVSEDREKPGHFTIIAEFNSYEEAMTQSNDPRMTKSAEAMAALVDGPITFYNLDVKYES